MKNLIIGIVVVAVLALGTFLVIQSNNNNGDKTSTENQSSSTSSDSNSTESVSELTIIYSDSGFSPQSAIVKSGGTITWVNESSDELQVGVNPHPSHSGDKEITDGQFVLSIASGEKTSVRVEKKGTYNYHNHLSSLDSGTVKVE